MRSAFINKMYFLLYLWHYKDLLEKIKTDDFESVILRNYYFNMCFKNTLMVYTLPVDETIYRSWASWVFLHHLEKIAIKPQPWWNMCLYLLLNLICFKNAAYRFSVVFPVTLTLLRSYGYFPAFTGGGRPQCFFVHYFSAYR